MNSIAGSSKSMPEKMPDKRMPPIKHFCLRVANKDMNPDLESLTVADKFAVNTNKYLPRHKYSNTLQAHLKLCNPELSLCQ